MVSEVVLCIAVAINYLPPRWFSAIFKLSMCLMLIDFFLVVIWLPIGVSNTYGFRSAKDVFTMTCKFLASVIFVSLTSFV